MRPRTVSLVALAAVLLIVFVVAGISQSQSGSAGKPADSKSGSSTTAQVSNPAATGGPANSVAVCRCGMVFAPTAATKSVTYEGKEYLVCSDVCYKIAMNDPAKAASDTQANLRKVISQSAQPMQTQKSKPE